MWRTTVGELCSSAQAGATQVPLTVDPPFKQGVPSQTLLEIQTWDSDSNIVEQETFAML